MNKEIVVPESKSMTNGRTEPPKDTGFPFSTEVPALLQRHFDQLFNGSGISVEIIKQRGYESILGKQRLIDYGFSKAQLLTPTLLMPIYTVDGKIGLHIHRPDNPRKNKEGKVIKYETPSGKGLRIDVPPICRDKLMNPQIRLFVTEGVKKADALASRGECVIDLLGVWGFKHKNDFGAVTISADLDYIALDGREVYIVFDNDVMTKPEVKRALEVFTEHLKRKGATIYHIYIPLVSDKKRGVDDYLLNHSIEDLLSNAVKQYINGVGQRDEVITYHFRDGFLYRNKWNRDGLIPIRIANFDARIIEEIIRDNGIETSHYYKIEARQQERNLGTVEVPASSFAGMNWIHKLGHSAIIEPGLSVKDYVRHYIQSESTPRRTVAYTHTGWRRLGDDWIYLHAGGAVGREGITISLSPELEKYALPTAPENETEAIRASLEFLEIGRQEIVLPAFAYLYLAPLTTLLSPMPNFSLYFYGNSGTFKSTLAMSMLSHYGTFEGLRDLSNFEDTPNSLELRAFALKDTLMVLDDYHPSSQRFLAQQKESMAQRMIREFSNRTGRGRLNSDSTEKMRYSPRGMLLITGEELVSLQSSLARTCVLEFYKGAIDTAGLSDLQSKTQLLPSAMFSYLQWIRMEGVENIQGLFKKQFPELRSKATQIGVHAKLSEQTAFLQFSLSMVSNWLLSKGILTDPEARELVNEGWSTFLGLVKEGQMRLRDEDPVNKFKDILGSLIYQGKVRLQHKENAGDYMGGESVAGEPIGWYDDKFFYLMPTPLWKAIQTYLYASQEVFPVKKNTLYRTLSNKNLLVERDGHHLISLKKDGVVRKILKLRREGIYPNEVTEVTDGEDET